MNKTMVICENLTKRFDMSAPWLVRKLTGMPKRELVAVDAVSFEIPRGQTYALVGESGSGKSTIARMVVGLLQPDAGGVTIDGHNLNTSQDAASLQMVRQTLQMVFQSPYSSLNPRWRVNDILLEPIRAFDLISDEHDQKRRVRELLDQVGLSASDAAKYPHEFSGGQRQRISIARGLMMAISSGVKYLGLKGHSNCRSTLCPCLSAMMSSTSDCGRRHVVV